MTINERVSPKRLAEIIARAEVCDDSVLTDYRDIESIARELQQYRAAAEPVAWMHVNGVSLMYAGDLDAPFKVKRGGWAPLYAAPQVTSVPDGIEAAARWVDAQREAYDDEHGRYDPDTGTFEFGNDAQLEYSTTLAEIAEGIRALRPTAAPAVQAEQEPVSQPYTLPECFERLFKHAQGLTFGNDWNRGTAAKYHRDLLIKAVDDCRGAIASGNSPVIPDGYALVPVEPTAEMLNAAWVSYGIYHPSAYRAMIAAAPKQEAE
ncbi:hypothetical protein [Atlantibacter hermannii]|uniref:hypothetical protein n=1 Tax=Atlantibacter hermannii TaxID=565 RepID=UPI0034D490A4